MNTNEFSTGDWIDRLALALPKLAEAQKPYLIHYPSFRLRAFAPLTGSNTSEDAFPLDDLRMLYQQARHFEGTVEEKDFEALLAELNPVWHIVNAHPTVAGVASPLIARDEFSMQVLTGSRTTCTTDLIAGLIDRAEEHSRDHYHAAARELNAFLARGDEEGSSGVLGGLDVGYDAVLFFGPTLTDRIAVTDTLALLPFAQVQALVEESEVRKLAPPWSGVHGLRSVGAEVRSFRWRPELDRADVMRDSDPAPFPGRFFHEARVFLELLAVSSAVPVLCLAELPGASTGPRGDSWALRAGGSGSTEAGRHTGSTVPSRRRKSTPRRLPKRRGPTRTAMASDSQCMRRSSRGSPRRSRGMDGPQSMIGSSMWRSRSSGCTSSKAASCPTRCVPG